MNINGSKSRFEDDALDNMVFVFPFLSFWASWLKHLIPVLFINFSHQYSVILCLQF